MMNDVKYDAFKNEFTITGCIDCPFCHWEDRCHEYNPYCSLNGYIHIEEWQEYYDVITYIPDKCPLRDPNFKLTRIL